MTRVLSETQYERKRASTRLSVIDGGRCRHASRNELAWKFFDLGRLTGKRAAEIIASVGLPSYVRPMANERTILEWQETGCRVELLCNARNRVVKVTVHSEQAA